MYMSALPVRCCVVQTGSEDESALQCVAVRCSVLQCVAVCCRIAQTRSDDESAIYEQDIACCA